MLKELFRYVTVSVPDYVRDMGYLKEVISIESRYERCREGWLSHLEKSRQTVCEALDLCETREKVVVLGSGLLLDLPLRELATNFKEVVLVDILHMPSVKTAVALFDNIKLVTADVTSVAERLYLQRPRPEEPLPSPDEPFLPECDQDCSLVVSLNLLSQLTYVPVQYLTKRLKWKDDSPKLLQWEERVMRAHYKSLMALNCTVCLISDWQMSYLDRHGNEIERYLTVPFLKNIKPYRQWTWELVPLKRESRRYSVELSVSALLKTKKGLLKSDDNDQTLILGHL